MLIKWKCYQQIGGIYLSSVGTSITNKNLSGDTNIIKKNLFVDKSFTNIFVLIHL